MAEGGILPSDNGPRATKDRPFYVQWHLTERCNLRCLHCYQSDFSYGTLSKEQSWLIAREIDRTLSAWNRKGRISLTGGEPFLLGEYLFTLLDYFENSGNFEWIGILTNGTLINSDLAFRLNRYCRLREVQVSLDGATAETHDAIRGKGAYALALRGISALKEAGVPTTIMFTLNAMNLHEVEKIIDLAAQIPVRAITVERMIPWGTSRDGRLAVSKEDVERAYRTVVRKKESLETRCDLRIRTSRPLWCLVESDLGGFCPVGFTSICVLHDGTLLPCRRLEIPIGNILTDGFFKVWYTSKILWDLRQKNRMRSACGSCEFLGKCRGCRAAAYAATGDYLSHDPHCWKGSDLDGESKAYRNSVQIVR